MLDEGAVKEILREGDLSPAEIRKKLRAKHVSFVVSYDRACSGVLLVSALLWLLPGVARWFDWEFLRFFRQLPSLEFPAVVILIGALLVIAAIVLEGKLVWMRSRRGGCEDAHETVVILRDGPYGVVRHPGYLSEMVYFGLLPVVLSRWVPFTVLAVVFFVIACAGCLFLIRVEDSFNLKKWGDEYRRYMAEVPAANVFKNFSRRRRA